MARPDTRNNLQNVKKYGSQRVETTSYEGTPLVVAVGKAINVRGLILPPITIEVTEQNNSTPTVSRT